MQWYAHHDLAAPGNPSRHEPGNYATRHGVGGQEIVKRGTR